MNASKGDNKDIFDFGAKTGNNFANLVQGEMLAPGMIKVEFAVELKMTRSNEEGELYTVKNYIKTRHMFFKTKTKTKSGEK